MAPHSSTVAWKIPWTEKPGRLQSMGLLRVGHDFTFTFHFPALEKEMATHSSGFAWRIPGTGERLMSSSSSILELKLLSHTLQGFLYLALTSLLLLLLSRFSRV